MTQTPTHVSLLQKFLRYFELVAAVGMVVPEPHVARISTLIETLAQEIEAFTKPRQISEGQTNQPEGFANPIAPAVLPVNDDGPKPIV